jgi:hypothetical protein
MNHSTGRSLGSKIITICCAFVWLINGLVCKLLGLVPRHQEIVGRILGDTHSYWLTKVIGVLEVLMCIWILSRIKPFWCTTMQIIIVLLMNVIEFVFAPDLLLFGRLNILVALFFISVVFLNEFIPGRRKLPEP